MHSPLPDASALEAGIIEDERPSRLSRVQDNVRNILRTQQFGSVQSSPPTTPTNAHHLNNHGLPTPPESPFRGASPQQPEVMPSPSTESTTSTTASSTPTTPDHEASAGASHSRSSYRFAVQQMAHQSNIFNTRAIAALNHPDVNDPSLATYLQQKTEDRQRRSWKRPRHGHGHGRKRHVAVKAGTSQWVLCVLAALLLSATVATYIVLATSSSSLSPEFHILFILGILLATIVFAHTLVRLLLLGNKKQRSTKVMIVPASRSRRHHHRHEHHHNRVQRTMPTLANDATTFIPATPIPVHMSADEVRPDSREAQPTATPHVELTPDGWDKDVEAVPNPPPAYGRWRGSVRANPDLLHWQAVPSPVDDDAPELPSPTYEEATAGAPNGPPSYKTRDSPARRREMQQPDSRAARVESVVAEPEMFEVRGFGLAM